MNKSTCLIHRQQPEKPMQFGASVRRYVLGRRFLSGTSAVLLALTLSATLRPTPLWAAETEKSAKVAAPVLPLGQLAMGKSMQVPMPKGAKYEVQDGSAQVRVEPGDGFLIITPLEVGNVAINMNGMAYGVKVVASAQLAPVPTAPIPTAPSAPSIEAPTLVPVAPAPSNPAPSANDQPLPPLDGPSANSAGFPAGVPAGMAPVSPPQVSPPQVSPPLPPPSRMPSHPAFPTSPVLPRDMKTSGVPIKIVNVTKGLASLLSFQRNILSVYFSDATVMDARAINARTLAVTGVGIGKSTLAVFTAANNDDAVGQLHMFHIAVEPASGATAPLQDKIDPLTVETAIRSAINDPRVQVSVFSTNEGAMAAKLTGRVNEAIEAKSAEETAALYATKVINGIVVDPKAPSYEDAFAPPTAPLTSEEIAQNQLRSITGNQTVEFTPLGDGWVLKGEVSSQAEAQQLLTLANTLRSKVIPLLVVRGPNGFTPAETPISSPEDREMTRRLQEVTGISTIYVMRAGESGAAIYGSVRNRMEFDRVQRYKVIIPVGKGGGTNNELETVSPTHGYKSPANVQVFVRIEDPAESALRLVTVDANVVEISRTAMKNLGVEFGSAQVISESTSPTTPATVVVAPDGTRTQSGGTSGITTRSINPTFQAGNILAGNGFGGFGGFGIIDAFRTRLNALYQNGNANILSKPNVTTLEGTEAQITIGGSRPIPQIQTSGGGQGTVQENIVFRRFGVIVTMRPTLLSDNTIILQIRVDVTDLDPTTGITRGNTFIPGETVRSVNNILVLKEGDIIALGGLITNSKRQQTSKVPILSQIPIIGALFQSRRFEKNESELAIFLTPSIKRVPVPSAEMEVGAIHPSSWPKLSGIDDGSGLSLNTSSAGQGQ